MGKAVIRFIAILFLTSSFCACCRNGVTARLREIEGYIQERPDSALAVLQRIDRSRLVRKADAAKFSLLYAMALDKNYIDTTDMSVIDPAIDYYSRHGSADEKLKAYYYQGVIHRNSGRTNDAAVSLHVAERYIPESKDIKAVALLHSMNALIFRDTYNISKFMAHTQEAQKLYELVGDKQQVNICYYDLACGQMGLKNFHAADSLFVLAESALSDDSYMMGLLLSKHAELKIFENTSDSSLAIGLLERKRDEYNEPWTIEDYYVYACAKAAVGDTNTCKSIIKALEDYNDGEGAFWLYRIADINGDSDAAINYLEKTVEEQDSALTDALSSTAMEALNNYEESEMQKQKHEYQVHVMTLILLVFALLFIGGIILSLFIIDRNRKNREIDGLIGVAETIQSAYLNNFKQNLNLLVDLNHIILDAENQHSHGQALLVRLKSTVPDYCRSDEARHELECRVNEHYGNIAADLRTDFPDLKDHDVLFYCFQILGFNANTIAVILGITVSNVYVKRKRLKEKLSQINGRPDEKYTRLM